MSDKYAIPHHLDEPYKLFLWTIDEVFAFLIPTFLGLIVFNYPLCGALVGSGGVYFLRKIKGEEGHYFIPILMYWYWPPLIPFEVIPPSYIRQWVG